MSDNKTTQSEIYIAASGELLKASASTLIDRDVGSNSAVQNKERPTKAPRGFYDPMVFLGPKKIIDKTSLDDTYDYKSLELNIRTQTE